MSPETVINIARHAMEVTILLLAVLIVPGLLVGLVVSIFQAATQINEVTLSFVPKLLVTLLVIVIAGPWIITVFVEYTKELYGSVPALLE